MTFRRALISVYDKTGIAQLARSLSESGCEIVSTGSTARTIADAGVPVTPVEQVTGFPECFDGRVKTLHPKIHGGILANVSLESHRAQLDELGIEPFDLVVLNLYPFAETLASGADEAEVVEQIDIGGPAMVRAAAKNFASVSVVVNPAYYSRLAETGETTLENRRALAAEAFAHTADYDAAIASWISDGEYFSHSYHRVGELRYGENPHQDATLYRTRDGSSAGRLASARQLGGKPMSYNNYQDIDAAWRAAYDFDEPAVAIIKHANPCGLAVGTTIADAHAKAFACDEQSAYGGVIAANQEIDLAAAQSIAPIFTEVVAAPSFTDDALQVLKKKANLRILEIAPGREERDERAISGGLLVQERDQLDAFGDNPANWTLVTGNPVPLEDLEFAWRAVRSVKSNAILLAKDGATVGIGMGQVNRVDSCRLAVERAGDRARGAVAASDAFFPFADGLEVLTAGGVSAVVQPGGSIRDDEVIQAAKEAGISMYVTGTRHFTH